MCDRPECNQDDHCRNQSTNNPQLRNIIKSSQRFFCINHTADCIIIVRQLFGQQGNMLIFLYCRAPPKTFFRLLIRKNLCGFLTKLIFSVRGYDPFGSVYHIKGCILRSKISVKFRPVAFFHCDVDDCIWFPALLIPQNLRCHNNRRISGCRGKSHIRILINNSLIPLQYLLADL